MSNEADEAPLVYWLEDPGHAWLVVPTGAVQIATAIHGVHVSEYSYMSPLRNISYLEEDADAPAFLTQGVDVNDTAALHEAMKSGQRVPTRHIDSFDDYIRRHGLVRYPDHD